MAKARAKTKPKTKTRTKKKIEVDFDDEESVRLAMAVALDVNVDDVTIKDDRGLGSFHVDTVYEVNAGHEYSVVRDEDTFEKLAIAVVTQDLEESPDNFEPNFIESHINIDRLRRDLHSDLQSSNYDRLAEDAKMRPERFIRNNSLDWPSPTDKQLREHAEVMSDENDSAESIYAKLKEMDAEDQWSELGEEPEVPDSVIESVAEGETERQLEDPMDYLRDVYGDEATKKAIEIAGIDVNAAAEEAVSVDGAAHFLCRYDGNYETGPSGFIYWRNN